MGCAERNGDDLGVEGLERVLVKHNLCHMVSTGQSGEVAQEDDEQVTVVTPIVG